MLLFEVIKDQGQSYQVINMVFCHEHGLSFTRESSMNFPRYHNTCMLRETDKGQGFELKTNVAISNIFVIITKPLLMFANFFFSEECKVFALQFSNRQDNIDQIIVLLINH